MQSQSRTLVVTIIVLLVAGGAFVLFGSSRAPIEHSAALDPPQVELFEAPNDWLTYVNRPGCFSIQYPPGAEVQDSFLEGPLVTGEGLYVSISLPDSLGVFSHGITLDLDPIAEEDNIDLNAKDHNTGDFLLDYIFNVWSDEEGFNDQIVQVPIGSVRGYTFLIEEQFVTLVTHGDFVITIKYFIDGGSTLGAAESVAQTLRFLDCDNLEDK